MTVDGSRRFTDQEVALVLRKASELDEKRGAQGGAGLSRKDLEDIAREVGISAESLSSAVDQIGRTSRGRAGWMGAPLTRKAIHAVGGELNQEALGRLIRLVDEHADSTGAISEALGSVRWTSSSRFGSSQVSLTPHDGETSIEVVEKTKPRLRVVLQAIPAAWTMMLVGSVAASVDLSAAGVALLFAGGAAVGLAAGRTVWHLISRGSAKRVERLAADLTQAAREAADAGLTSTKTDE